MRKLLMLLLVPAAMFAGGCGATGGSDEKSQKPEAVIRGWSDSLRSGNVDKAARYFALPATVANGTPPIELKTLNAVRNFNVALPCGAKVVRTATAGKFTTATFSLTGRLGPGGSNCGGATGQKARTTFVIEDGKIKEWRRVSTKPQSTGPVA